LGYFNAAYRTVQMIEVGTVALTGALLPTFSRLAVQDRVQLNRLCNDSIRLMVVLGGTVGGQLVLFGTPLVKIVFGAQYAPAGPALELLGAALLFLMPSAVMQAMFQAIDRQDVYLKLAFFGLCCMAIMGVVLIPSHAAIGAAIAALVTEILLLLAGALYLVREGWGLRLLKPLARVLAIVALLAVPIWAGRSWIESAYVLLITALISLAAYISMILFAGIITPKEFRSLWMNRPLREKQSK
jgi:O-antigen/teichoic acid export membrane protein